MNIKKTICFLTVLTSSLFFVSSSSAHTNSIKPEWISPFAWAVGICETGKGHNHPDFNHRGDYQGFVGWYKGTWDMDKVGITTVNHAYQASPKIQNKVAAASFKKGRYFGCIVNGGYKYWS